MIHTLANHSLASFTLEFPRKKSGKGKLCQSDPDLLPSKPSWVQPWTWTAVLDGAMRHLAGPRTMDRLFLCTQKTPAHGSHRADARNTLGYSHSFERCRVEQQIFQFLLPGLQDMIPGWEVVYITQFFFKLHCLPSAYRREETGLKQGSELMLLRLHCSAITWSRQSSSYESKHRYFLTK